MQEQLQFPSITIKVLSAENDESILEFADAKPYALSAILSILQPTWRIEITLND